MHLFIKCPINDAKIYCESSGVVGSDFPEYYISGEFAYLWLTGWKGKVLLDGEFSLDSTLVYPSSAYYYSMSDEYKGKYHNKLELFSDSKLYRISLTDFSVNYFPIELEPLDQFSFHEDGGDLYMFGLSSKTTGELIKIKEHMFKGQYSPQPDVIANVTGVNDYTNNYFLSDSFIYGTMNHFGELNNTESTMINLHTGTSSTLDLNHSANRFENLGEKALVVGETEDLNLGLTVIPEATPQAYQQLFLHDRLEGETRSHAFNATSINDMAIFGLTTQLKSKGEEEHNYYHWGEDVSSDITFFNWDNGVRVAGELVSKENSKDEFCEVSCEDWYGNTRPFFIGDRIFGLSGDELIEAKLVGSQVIEIERISF
ncbi:hypothetical protein [Kangiella shandongensis]|uniref:hypothetical protein n=1 Tax=Kangiella shandongensis TaxID=2763258 RepID=UPI001CBDD2C6|nr:hypothetical protein [Kangiella shandongensis]